MKKLLDLLYKQKHYAERERDEIRSRNGYDGGEVCETCNNHPGQIEDLHMVQELERKMGLMDELITVALDDV